MTVRTIIEYPHPNLRLVSAPVTAFDEELKELVRDMFETMYKSQGIGLAAPQIDIQKQIVVIDVSEDHSQPLVLINPKITRMEGSTAIDEGCLSVPLDYRAKVDRAEKITIEFFNEEGVHQQREADDLLAICMQHELDHLQGKLFIDYLSSLKKGLYDKKLEKYRRYKRKAENAKKHEHA